ncbi:MULTISPECIES: SGNH/GDSL hydrolase family protein [unclassified Rathayibacter]|uniref:SGNH/GDSL hydrolase family protein n=1 Tax=unclassified Rathayibacter TaxID=2609250 RepID=UPI00188A8EE0|nr:MULTISPECIES: SGNH/GDSL hydrolase family protein [unclassified Rathayibacter]MBF4461277.1 SGNH/GDSL hydrolase family protein [Rathayibacter sp. VKM Ac-2879]MBF4502688.1 SGNH/GDSL hydrolase family protein [Rathayibacter sp. VKM Ac-2878]
MIRSRSVRLGVVAALAVAMLAGCTPGPGPVETSPPSGPLPFQAGSIAALGDSISAGVAACGQNKPCPSASWTTGADESVDSVARRAGEAVNAVPEITNVAAKGATASDLPAQAEKAVAASPGLVTILIGANDVCRKRSSDITTPDDFRASIVKTLSTLSSGAPEATIFVSSVPNLLEFFQTERTDSEAVARWAGSSNCNSLLFDPTSDDADSVARRNTVGTTIDAYNAILGEACAATAHCVYDGGALHDLDVTTDDISDVDHFHPSRQGQAKLADIAWTALLAGAR